MRDCSAAIELARPYINRVSYSLTVLTWIAEKVRAEPETLFQEMDLLIQADPGVAEAYLLRGFARWYLDDVAGAIQDFQQAEDMTYMVGVLPPVWANVFDEFADLEAAVAAFETALTLVDPDSLLASLIQGSLADLR